MWERLSFNVFMDERGFKLDGGMTDLLFSMWLNSEGESDVSEFLDLAGDE